MPYEIDDQGLRVIGYNEPIQFYDPNRNLRQEIYLQEDGSLAIGSLSVGTPTSGGNDLPYGGDAQFDDLTVTGDLVVGAGNIAGWRFEPGHLYSGAGSNQAGMMPGTYPFYAGASSPASAAFYVTQAGALTATSATITGTITATAGTIGGWTATATTLHAASNVVLDAGNKAIYVNDTTFGNAGIQLEYNSGTPRVYIGDGDQRYLQFDGTDVEIGGSLIVHGSIEAAVFNYRAVTATSGSLVVTIAAGRLLNDVTTVAAGRPFDIDVEDPAYGHVQLFAVGDVLRLRKVDATENWITVSSVTDNTTYYSYTCTLSDGSATTFNAGTPIIDYGQDGDGYLYMSADDPNAPFYSVRTWETNPWTAGNVTENARLGNMRNAFGTGANDRYGFAVGDYSGGNYLSYNAETADTFVLKAGDSDLTIDVDGLRLISPTAQRDRATIRYYATEYNGNSAHIRQDSGSSTGYADLFKIYAVLGSAGVVLTNQRYQYYYATSWFDAALDINVTALNPDSAKIGSSINLYGDYDASTEYGVIITPSEDASVGIHLNGDVDITGSITKSTALGCRVYRATTQAIADATLTAISYSHEINDTDGCWSSGNATRLYAQTDGYYIAGASIQWDSTFSGDYMLSIESDDGRVLARNGEDNANTFHSQHMSICTGMFWMDSGEYIEVKVRQSSGSSRSIAAAGAGSAQRSNVAWITRIA